MTLRAAAEQALKYRKKPVVIEAFQMTRERRRDNRDWPAWLNEAWCRPFDKIGAVSCEDYPNSDGTDRLVIRTLEGVMTVGWDDWIIRGVAGELYACKPDIFAATYERAALAAEQPQPKRATGWAAPKDRYVPPVLFSPYTGEPRDVRDVQSDPQGVLIVPPGAAMLAAAPPPAAPEPSEAARMYIDGEWNSYRGDLLSLALVGEDGCEWYEVLEFDGKPDPWVAANVMPKLRKAPVSLELMQGSLQRFLDRYPAGVHIVADWPEDIERFCRVLVTGPGQRLGTPPLTMEVVRIEPVSADPHNALADARALRDALRAASAARGR